jgi:hypothetical protein
LKKNYIFGYDVQLTVSARLGDFVEKDAENLITQADVIGITGTAFTNHAIGPLLWLCLKYPIFLKYVNLRAHALK